MADHVVFESPIVTSYPTSPGAALQLADESASSKLIVRAAGESAAAGQLGVNFAASRAEGDVLICGQRPTEWIVLGANGSAQSFVDGLDRAGHVSVIDHTHSRALFRLSGHSAAALLEKVCSLDWSDPMTPDGAVVSASVAKTNCDIIRHDLDATPSYLIACDRSFGQYLFDAILDAGVEFDIGVASQPDSANSTRRR